MNLCSTQEHWFKGVLQIVEKHDFIDSLDIEFVSATESKRNEHISTRFTLAQDRPWPGLIKSW